MTMSLPEAKIVELKQLVSHWAPQEGSHQERTLVAHWPFVLRFEGGPSGKNFYPKDD